MARIWFICLVVAIIQNQPGFASDGSCRDIYSPVSLSIRFYQKYISDLHYGHCRFSPSCSQYALEAFNAYGIIRGSVLAADRLVRCNRGARRFYTEGVDGRLLDPVTGAKTRQHLLVPRWLLPPAEGPLAFTDNPEPPETISDADEASKYPMNTISLASHIEFADYLARDGDCDRAITEYKYVAFEAGTDEALRWSKMKSGECYYRLEQWEDAAEAYLEAARISRDDCERDTAIFMAAACLFNAQRFDESAMLLDQCSKNSSLVSYDPVPQANAHGNDSGEGLGLSHTVSDSSLLFNRVLFLSGLTSMARGDWKTAERQMNTLATQGGKSPFAGGAVLLAERAKSADALPNKSSTLAMILSAIVPGSGQFYTGRFNDGLRHLIFNGLLGYEVYRLIDDENYAGAYLLAGVTLPFYAGNIAGAKRSAEYYNLSKRIAAISKWTDEAGNALR